MNILKKLFSSKKEEEQKTTAKANSQASAPQVSSIFTQEHFKKRYEEQDIRKEPEMLKFPMDMLTSFFKDNQIAPKHANPINHPENLDQAVSEGLGFHQYCQAMQIPDSQIIFIMAFAFASYMIDHLDFKLYKDNEASGSLRSMTIQREKEGAVMSLYPMEYAVKVLRNEATYTELIANVHKAFRVMPTTEQFLANLNDVE